MGGLFMAESTKQRKSVFDNPLLSTKIKSAKVKIFPEAGIGYFIGPTLALLSNSILSNFLNRYMTDVLGLAGAQYQLYLILLPLISVIFVILGNILVGRLMDKMKTRAGKARPLILVAIPLSIIALLFLFLLTPLNFDADGKAAPTVATLAMFAIGYNLWFAIAYPFYFTNHSALINLSTRSSKDRSLLATISNATTLAAMGLTSMVIPTFFMGMLFVEGSNGVDAQPSWNAWKVFIIGVMILSIVGMLLEYYFTRERITEESFTSTVDSSTRSSEEQGKKALAVKKQAKICFKDKFWWIMMAFFFLYQLGGCLKNFSLTYYAQSWFADANGNYSSTFGGQMQGILSIIGAIPTALGMLIVWPLTNKIGKGKAILLGAVVAVIGGAIGFIAPDNFAVVAVSFAIKALGSTPAMYISLALLADILDHQEAMKGARTDSFSMTVYGAIMAGMTGLVNGIINIAISSAGYDTSTLATNETLRTVLLWVFTGGETICYGLIFILFLFMKVERYSTLDHIAIEGDQRAVAAKKGIEFVPASVRLELEEKKANEDVWIAEKAELKATCAKKGLNYEEELRKLTEKHEAAIKAAEEKKKAAEEKKSEKERLLKEKHEAKLASMSSAEREAYEKTQAEKAEKKAKYDAEVKVEFEKLREENAADRDALLSL